MKGRGSWFGNISEVVLVLSVLNHEVLLLHY